MHVVYVDTKEIPFDETLTVQITGADYSTEDQEVFAEVTVPSVATLYADVNTVTSYTANSYNEATCIADALAEKEGASFEKVEVDDLGYAAVSMKQSYRDNTYYMHFFVVSAEGKVSHIYTSTSVSVPKK